MGFWNDGISSSTSHNRPAYVRTSSGSHYSSRARPRSGYLNRIYYRLRKFLRDIYYYARRHPMKVFMLVIMPLLTGGALHRILAQFGIRLPPGLVKAFGGMPGGGRYDAYGNRRGGEWVRERGRFEGGGGEGFGGLGNLMGIAKMFM